MKLEDIKNSSDYATFVRKMTINESLELRRMKDSNGLAVVSSEEGGKEVFKNKDSLKKAGFKWNADLKVWYIDADKKDQAVKTLSSINKVDYFVDKLEDLQELIPSSNSDVKNLIGKYINSLANETDEKAASDQIRKYLEFYSNFHSYSFNNSMLIFLQKPNAKKVASRKVWMEKNRYVHAGKAIMIFAPIFSKKEENPLHNKDADGGRVVSFKLVPVWDIGDTTAKDGGEIPEAPQWFTDNNPSETADMLYKYVEDAAKGEGIDVTSKEAMGGEKGYSAGGHINITSGVAGVGRVATMIHEYAHELMHHREKSKFYAGDEVKANRELKELQAESVSYIVLKHYGIPAEHQSTYLALWKAKGEVIRKNFELLTKVSKHIIDKIDSQAGSESSGEESDGTENMSDDDVTKSESINNLKRLSGI